MLHPVVEASANKHSLATRSCHSGPSCVGGLAGDRGGLLPLVISLRQGNDKRKRLIAMSYSQAQEESQLSSETHKAKGRREVLCVHTFGVCIFQRCQTRGGLEQVALKATFPPLHYISLDSWDGRLLPPSCVPFCRTYVH